jgi:hypothetical protein
MSWAKIVFPEFIGHLLLQFCRSMTFWNVQIDKKYFRLNSFSFKKLNYVPSETLGHYCYENINNSK